MRFDLAALGVALLLVATPALAQHDHHDWGGHNDWHGGGGHWNDHGGWGGEHRGYWRGDGGNFAGGVLGGIIGSVIAPVIEPPQVIVVPQPAPQLAPWSPEWYTYCGNRYKSFDAHTGYFMGYDGQRYFCQ